LLDSLLQEKKWADLDFHLAVTGEDEGAVDEEDSLPVAGEVSPLEVEGGEAVVVEHLGVVVVGVEEVVGVAEAWEPEGRLLWSLTGTRVCLSPGERRTLC